VTGSFKISVYIYETARRHMPTDSNTEFVLRYIYRINSKVLQRRHVGNNCKKYFLWG